MNTLPERDHGGGLDAAVARFGGPRKDWLDLSTGINPNPYPVGRIDQDAWTSLPDSGAADRLVRSARRFWNVPEGAAIVAAPGVSALIARLPALAKPGKVQIAARTYNEHAAAFAAQDWIVTPHKAPVRIVVHPNNPDGILAEDLDIGRMLVVDESFCDTCPDKSQMALADQPGVLILKSFGKFWGLAGMRLGFAIGDSALVQRLSEMLGPWPVSGPALEIGTTALSDDAWAAAARTRLTATADRLDQLMTRTGAELVGGTSLFRLYRVEAALAQQEHLARHHIWTRVFPYTENWLRLGLPADDRWQQLEAAL